MQLLKGDCLEVMKSIPDKSVDMVLCDLPYGTTACKWDNVIPFEPMWECYNRIIKDNGAIVLFGIEPFTSYLICSMVLKILRLRKRCLFLSIRKRSITCRAVCLILMR